MSLVALGLCFFKNSKMFFAFDVAASILRFISALLLAPDSQNTLEIGRNCEINTKTLIDAFKDITRLER